MHSNILRFIKLGGGYMVVCHLSSLDFLKE